MQHISGFVKITEILSSQYNSNIHQSPNLKEIKLFSVTNKLVDSSVLNSFVYSFNESMLHKNYAKFGNKSYSILITEELTNDYKELTSYLQSHKTLPECVLFELIYTLHTLNIIKLKHMDLHGANIFIKTLPKSEHKMIKYEAVVSNQLHSFYVPTTHVIKIIDLDSGNKQSYVQSSLKNIYKEKINNPHKFTGKVKTNDKSNILKLIHTLIRSNPSQSIADQLYYMGIRSSSTTQSVPFFPNADSVDSGLQYNKMYLKKYGLLLKLSNGKLNFLPIDNSVIWSPERMLFEMILMNKFQQCPKKHHIKYSQKYLFK